MGFVDNNVADAPRAEVFACQDRRGEIQRLLPPCQPIKVLRRRHRWPTVVVYWVFLEVIVVMLNWTNPHFASDQCGAPSPVRNARWLTRIVHRPALLPVPGIGWALLLGERELATASQRTVPCQLIESAYRFRRPVLEQCLPHHLAHLIKETP